MQGTTRLFVARHSTYARHEIRIHESKRLLKLPLPVDTIGTVTYKNPHNSNLCSFVLNIEVRQGTHPNGWTISSVGIPSAETDTKNASEMNEGNSRPDPRIFIQIERQWWANSSSSYCLAHAVV